MRRRRINSKPFSFAPSAPSDQWPPYTITLLTPMIGGGTESWQIDPEQPIRPSEIKQQLRFWWRTMQDPNMEIADLLKQESELFGDTERASRVRLEVIQVKPGKHQFLQIVANARNPDWKGCPQYVLFPLLGQKDEQGRKITHFDLLKTFSFDLRVACPPRHKVEIENALTLWLLFGGLGGRTRRGAGSLYSPLLDQYKSDKEILSFVSRLAKEARRARPVNGATPPRFPTLANGRLVVNPIRPTKAILAWNALLGVGENGKANEPPGYGDLRQGTNLARGANRGASNSSYWPEADALREISGVAPIAPRPILQWFPRAAYGLPLQISFNRDADRRGRATDPDGTFNLLPKFGDRWPSPVILKVTQTGNQLFEIGLLLNQRLPEIRGERQWNETKSEFEIPPTAQPGYPSIATGLPIPSGHPHDGLFAALFRNITPHVL